MSYKKPVPQVTTYIEDSTTTAITINSSVTNSFEIYYKLVENSTLLNNKTITLGTIATTPNRPIENGTSITIALINIIFNTFSITILDESNIMQPVVVSSNANLKFIFVTNKWVRVN